MSLARFGVNRRADGLLDQIPPHLDAPRPAAPGRAIAQEALDTRRAINFADIHIAVSIVGDHMRPMELASLTAAAADARELSHVLAVDDIDDVVDEIGNIPKALFRICCIYTNSVYLFRMQLASAVRAD